MELNLQGKTALVTGASAGIGRGIALALAAEGVRTAVVARRRALLSELAAQVTAAGGPAPLVLTEDLMAPDAADRIARTALEGLGSVDILINNAGGTRPLALDAPEHAWEEALTFNFVRHRQLTHRLLSPMIERRWGRIINITGKSEPKGINGAFFAKAALHSWAKGLSNDVARHGVTVNCIPPGLIESQQTPADPDGSYARGRGVPVGKVGVPADIANLVCFLASPRARYITGAVIPVDGGLRRYQF